MILRNIFKFIFLSVIVFSILISCANPEISEQSENSKISKPDTDESNFNTDNMQYAISGPDLDITKMKITSSTNDCFCYDIKIKNKGNVAIPDLYNVVIQNFYSKNKVYDTNDVPAGGEIIGPRIIGEHRSLAAGESITLSYYALGDLPSGMNYVIVLIDYWNSIEETNEDNNYHYITVRPNLDITKMELTSSTNDCFCYDIKIKNKGNVAIPDLYYVVLQNFYSKNKVYDTNDVPAGGEIIGPRIIGEHRSLAAGKSITLSYYALGDLPSGMNYVIALIDYSNLIEETNEDNNTYALLVD